MDGYPVKLDCLSVDQAKVELYHPDLLEFPALQKQGPVFWRNGYENLGSTSCGVGQ